MKKDLGKLVNMARDDDSAALPMPRRQELNGKRHEECSSSSHCVDDRQRLT